MRRVLASIAISAAALGMVQAIAEAGGHRARGDTRLFAYIPTPGFPARAYVHPNGRVYEGTFTNPLGDHQRSRVLEYSAGGTLERSWTIQGQDLAAEHGVQVATSDTRGRLVLLNRAPARALVLDMRTGTRARYASFPDLPICPLLGGGSGERCSPALRDEPPMPNYAAWGRDGSLYVTDFLQAVIWRVPPGGGRPGIWLADRRLDGDMFGTTGIVLAPDHRTLLVTQQSSAGLADGNPTTGKLYSIPIRRHHRPGPVSRIWESEPVDAPDGFWIGRSGDFYIALAGANQIAVVAPNGHEVERFGAAVTGDNGSPVPFDTPSSVMFLGRRLMVPNQSFFTGAVDPSNQAILDVYAGERGMPEYIPRNAGRSGGWRHHAGRG